MSYTKLSFLFDETNQNINNSEQLLSLDTGREIALFVAKNGHNSSTIQSLIKLVRRKFFLSEKLSTVIVNQVLGIRNVCANWMNFHAAVSADTSGNTIYNTVAPSGVTELKDSTYETCKKYFPLYDQIYVVNDISQMKDEIDYIVDLAIQWSKPTGDGDWEYYKGKVTEGYDYNKIYSPLTFRFE